MSKIDEIKSNIKDGRRVTIRSLVPDDAAELLNVAKRVFAEDGQHTLTELSEFNYTVEQERELIRKHLDLSTYLMIGPFVEGRLVGMLNFSVGARRRNSHQGEFGVSVLPEFQRLGIGRILVESLLNWAAQVPEIETVRLRVHEKNTKARELYLKLGFTQEGSELRGVKFKSGHYDNVIIMAKHIKQA